MNADSHDAASPCIEAAPVTNSFTARAIEDILTERGWFAQDSSEPAVERSAKAFSTWMTAAAALLGPHAPDRTGLADLLSLVFCYDAESLLATAGAQDVMARAGAREVIRELASRVLAGSAIDSDRFKAIIEELKSATRYRSRELFHPIRLALAGRAGEGELDRVILLLDSASELPFVIKVKNTRQRMLEFCSALD